MADNILRVGAEFDVGPLISGAEESVAAFDQIQDALAQAAATAEAAGETYQVTAANLMASGIAAQDVTQNLVRWGATQQQADEAVKAVNQSVLAQVPALAQQAASVQISATAQQASTQAATANVTVTQAQTAAQAASIAPTVAKAAATQVANVATAQQTTVTASGAAQIAALQNQVNQLNIDLQQLQTQLANTTTRTGGMVGAMAAARVEAGALTGSTGMMVGGLARAAAQSSILAPLISAAFPVFAIVAFIAILDAALSKLMEWGDEIQKEADRQADFDRAMLKSVDTLNESKERLVALSSANAEFAEKLAHSGEKVLDLSESTKKLNEQIEDSSQGYFKRLKEGLGIVTTEIGLSIGAIDREQHSLEQWNRQINDAVKHQSDLGTAIAQLNEEIKTLQTTESSDKSDRDNRVTEKRIEAIARYRDALIAQQEAVATQQLSLQISSDQKLLEEHEKILRARASAEETEARTELRAHAITFEEERTMLLDAETKRRTAEEAVIDSKITELRREASARIITEQTMTAGIRELSEQRSAVEIESETKRKEIIDSIDQQILRRTVEIGDARITAAHTVSEAIAKLDEDRSKREFQEADSIKDIETTAATLTTKTTATYSDQIAKLQERAALLESTLTIQKSSGALGQAVTADLGTEDFAKQVKQIQTLDAAKYAELIEFDSKVRQLLLREVDEAERVEKEKSDRVKRIHAEEVEENVRSLSENLTREESLYHDDIAHLQELHDEKKLTLREYTQAAIMFANEEYSARAATLQEEMNALKAARDADYITELQYEKKVEALHAQLAKFQEEREKEVTQFQKEEIAKREQAMAAATKKITDEFVQGINRMIQGQESLGRIAAQTGSQIALHLVDQGIERVVTKYGEDFAKIIASHSQFITQFISDHSTFLATLLGIETTSDAKKLAQTIASNTTQITSDAGLSFAAGFASVMEALPFPENVATAPEVAAAAAAQTEAGAFAFEKGGIVPEPKFHFDAGGVVPAYLHAGEMVLPKHISSAIQTAVPAISNFNRSATNNQFNAGASQGAVTKTMHNNINLKIENRGGGGIDHDAIIASVKKGIRLGSLNFD